MVARAALESSSALAAGAVSRERTGSWTLPAPAGAYSELPAWSSAEVWFDALLDVLATPAGEECRAAAKVGRDTLLRVAYADRKAADQATGRGVATAHETVAAQLGMSAKTVQRVRRLIERLGLAVTVVEGRYLTTAERAAATARHGGRQDRAASTRALIMPREVGMVADRRPVENVHLPSPGRVKSSSPVRKYSPTRALARTRKATAARRPAKTTGKTLIRSTKPRTLAVQQLAAELARRMPWLVRDGRHVGHLCDALDRQQLVQRGWTSQQILDRIDTYNRSTSTRTADPVAQRDPVSYLVWMLRRAIAPDDLSPSVEAAERRDRNLAARRSATAEAAARRAQLDAERDQIDAAIAAMHAQFPRRHRPRRGLL